MASDPTVRVISDTGPIHYLVLIDRVALLPALFAGVLVPHAVRDELNHSEAPDAVRHWIAFPPPWLGAEPDPSCDAPDLDALDPGERATILSARALRADLILMDDRAGVAAARADGFAVTGTLGLIGLAARRGLVDVADAIARLRHTSFRCRPELYQRLMDRHRDA